MKKETKQVIAFILLALAIMCIGETRAASRPKPPRCGHRVTFRQAKRQVVKVVGIFVLSCVAAGVYMEKTRID